MSCQCLCATLQCLCWLEENATSGRTVLAVRAAKSQNQGALMNAKQRQKMGNFQGLMIRRKATEHGEILLKSNGARLQRLMDRKPCCPGGLRARTNCVSRGVGCESPCSGDCGSLVVELCTLATGQQGASSTKCPFLGSSQGACRRFRAIARGYDVAVFGNNQQNCGELHSGATNQ